MKCSLCKGKMTKGMTNLPFQTGEEYMVVVNVVKLLLR
jgi:hypothetical protein